MDLLEQTLLQNLPANTKKSRKCISFNCPCCLYMGEQRPDSRGRGGLFIESDHIGYNCFNCGFKFRQYKNNDLEFETKKFMELIGVPKIDVNRIQLEYMKNRYSNSLLQEYYTKKEKPKTNINFDFKECELPSGSYFIHDIIKDSAPDSDVMEAYNYAQDRGIDKWPYLVWCDNRNSSLNKRLTIPFMSNEKIVGYTSRSFLPNVKKEDRYITKNPNTGRYVFNVDVVKSRNKFLIVNESPIDSILFNGVATMSCDPTYKQLEILNYFQGTKILVPDLTEQSGRRFIKTAINNNWSVFFPIWDSSFDLGKAVKVYGRLFVLNMILKHYESNSVKIKVKEKLA